MVHRGVWMRVWTGVMVNCTSLMHVRSVAFCIEFVNPSVIFTDIYTSDKTDFRDVGCVELLTCGSDISGHDNKQEL